MARRLTVGHHSGLDLLLIVLVVLVMMLSTWVLRLASYVVISRCWWQLLLLLPVGHGSRNQLAALLGPIRRQLTRGSAHLLRWLRVPLLMQRQVV